MRGVDGEMKHPRVTVAMPACNAEPWIGEAIASVQGQTLRDWELVVIDDGSSDRTADIAEQLAANDARIRVERQARRGITATRNRILELARGHYLAMQDADDTCAPGRLEAQVAYLEAHPQCALVTCRVLMTDPWGAPIRQINRELTHERIDAVNMGAPGFIVCNAYTARLSAMREAGGFRDDYPLVEDRDLFLRLAERYQLGSVDQVLYFYRRHWRSMTQRHQLLTQQCSGRAIADARRRRGLPAADHADSPEPNGHGGLEASMVDTRRIWAWWSLEAGYVATARRHALAALLRSPWSGKSWRVAACAMRAR